ncbi:MAG: ribosome maturation factor RimM [Parvibaculaceae bacterium]|nr:ribosome maturation factor RimM [Parvibaculaceae bacterium]
MTDSRVCVGVIVGAHGVRGEVKVKPFTGTPQALDRYGPLSTDDGRTFTVKVTGAAKEQLICRLDGLGDRNGAEAMKGVLLYVGRDRLPALPEDLAGEEWYQADLIGLEAVGSDGRSYGRIVAVDNFGAGDLLEIAPAPGVETVYLPFTAETVPEVRLASGTVLIDPPYGIFETDEAPEDGERRG